MAEKTNGIAAYKGFDQDLKCRGFQFEIGKTYRHIGKVSVCNSGFHACENPLAVFEHYPPTSRFAIVKCAGKISKGINDKKIACGELTVEAEIRLPELISEAVEWINSRVDLENKKISNTGNGSVASNTGNRSVASNTGYYSAAEVSGLQSIACALGAVSKAKAAAGGAIVCVYRNDDGDLIHIRSAKVGDDGIKADTWYMLDDTGEFVECE